MAKKKVSTMTHCQIHRLSNGGLGVHSQRGYMQDAKQADLRIVNISPIRDDVAEFLDARWMAITLAAMLGQIGLPGGGIGFGYAAENKVGTPKSPFSVARVADMLLHPNTPFQYNGREYRYPDIRMIYWAGGNPFHHHQDLNRLHRAWQRPETIVCNEIWWNSTARHSDIVLPTTSPLERNDSGSGAGDAWLQAMPQAVQHVEMSMPLLSTRDRHSLRWFCISRCGRPDYE